MSDAIKNLPKFGRSAEVRSASFDENEYTIDVVWTTGAAVRRTDWWTGRSYIETLEVSDEAVRLDRLNAGAPFLDTHDDWSLSTVIGSVVPGTARIENGIGLAKIKLSRAPSDADIVSKIRDGIIRNVSVGYAIHKVIKTDTDGDRADEEWHVVDWEPLEISAVPVPADAGSQIRKKDRDAMTPCEFVVERKQPAEPGSATEAGLADENTTAEIEAAAPEANNDNKQEARVADTVIENRAAEPAVADRSAPKPVDVEAAVRKAQDEERKRVAEIRKLGKEAGEEALADTAIENGDTVDAFRSALLEALMKREAPAIDGRVRAKVGEEHHEKRAKAMQEALLHRVDPTKELSDGAREYRGFTLMDMAREALELRGEHVRGLSRDEIAARALAQRSGYHTTSDFPVILGNVINTSLRAGYEQAPQTFRPLVREVSAADFKAINRAQLGGNGGFQKVNESGEYKRGSLVESKESYGIATYGEVIAITRKVIINDDMNAFGRIPQILGQQAAQLESDLIWYQILSNPTMGDGVTLFHATHKNLPTGAAFGVDSLGVARATMAKQTDLDGKTVLNVRPQYLIVPVALETKAEQELKSNFYADTSSKVATASMRSLEIIAEARLDNGIDNPTIGAKVNGSATAWYLAASPAQIDTVEIAYLEGQRGIYTETRNGFDVDGVEVKARLDVGAKAMDHRGLLKNAGQ